LNLQTNAHSTLTKLEQAHRDPDLAITSLGTDMRAIFRKQLDTIRKERQKKKLEANQRRSPEEQQQLEAILSENLREKQRQNLVLKKSRCGLLSPEEQTRLDELSAEQQLLGESIYKW